MVVDFAELRNKILAGENDVEAEALPSPIRAELREDNMTLFSILLAIFFSSTKSSLLNS